MTTPRCAPCFAAAVLLAGLVSFAAAEEWLPKPLGPEVKPGEPKPAPQRRQAAPTLQARAVSGPALTLVEDGKPRSVIVTAAAPTESARRAALELQRALKLISGADVPILAEDQAALKTTAGGLSSPRADHVILVGETTSGAGLELTASNLPPESYRLVTRGNTLAALGRDTTPAGAAAWGSRHAVMALLERHLGVRWLWPGPLGEVVPRAATVRVGPFDETDRPAIGQRKLRNWQLFGNQNPWSVDTAKSLDKIREYTAGKSKVRVGVGRLGFTEEQFNLGYLDSYAWFARQRLGSHLDLNYGHAFGGWWEKYGAERPDWFALQPNGARTQSPARERLCVTHPDLIAEVARTVRAKLRENPTLDAASISPNDGGLNSFCMCERCRRMDPPAAPRVDIRYQVEGRQRYVSYPSLSDRYAAFYSKVAELVAAEFPDRMVGAYAYSVYRTPPLYVKVHPNVFVGFVGLNYVNDTALERDRQSWNGWAASVEKLLLRPNLFHAGGGLPLIYARKMAADIRHCYETGMIAADFDSVIHHWATQGLNYYLLARLLWDPSQDVEAIIEDYCRAGFGEAAPSVRAYYARLEALTDELARTIGEAARGLKEEELREEEEDDAAQAARPTPKQVRRNLFAMAVPTVYTPQAVAGLEALLNQARKADADQTVRARVEFLAQGLRFLSYQSRLYAFLAAGEGADFDAAARLLAERQEFLKHIFEKDRYAVNAAFVAWDEADVFQKTFVRRRRAR